MFYLIISLSLVAGLFVIYNQQKQNFPKVSGAFRKFQVKYLIAYFLATAADWCQGPYVYKIYEEYEFSIGQIGTLFILGFLSSAVVGTFIGSLADKYGRKKSCLLYCFLYIVSCMTKHVNSFYVLAIGRVTGGIGTSILYSSFESWMCSEHDRLEFDAEWRGYTFSIQVLGNGIVAIASGLVTNFATQMTGKITAPFDISMVASLASAIVIYFFWEENYGDRSGNWWNGIFNGFEVLQNDKIVLFLGLSQSFFESGMYIFVFMWTPALERAWPGEVQHGLIFTAFMLSVMIGSSIFQATSARFRISKVAFIQFIVAAVILTVPVFSVNGTFILYSFLVFEACVGVFWSALGTLKGTHIPEDVRSTVMNYFRLPTNFFVLSTLKFVESMSIETVFLICVVLVGCSAVFSYFVIQLEKQTTPNKTPTNDASSDE